MARGDNSGLFALLDAMARRDQISESRMDRELRRDQLMLAIEEIRGQNAVNREKMSLERARFSAQFEIEKSKADVDRRRAELEFKSREMEMNLQLGQLKIAQRQADDAHKRNEVELDTIKDDRSRRQIEDYRLHRQGVMATRDQLEAENEKDLVKNAEAYAAVMQTMGQTVDGKFEFLPIYKELYERYVRGSGLPKGSSQQVVAQVWAEEFARQYRDTLGTQLAEINKNRAAQGLPEYTSDSQLDTTSKQAVLESAYRDWMTGSNGPLTMAAKGSMTDAEYKKLVASHGGNQAMVDKELLSMVRFTGGKSFTIGNRDLKGFLDPNIRGNKEIVSALTLALSSFGPTAGAAASTLINTSDRITSFNNNYALLSKEAMLYSALESQASANLAKNRGPLTKEQEDALKALNALQWEQLGASSHGMSGDGGKDPAPIMDSDSILVGAGGGVFSHNWFHGYSRLLEKNAIDEHALADANQRAAADTAAGAAMVKGITGEDVLPPKALPGMRGVPFMEPNQLGILKSTVQGSVSGGASERKQFSQVNGQEFLSITSEMTGPQFMDWAFAGFRERASNQDAKEKEWIERRRIDRQQRLAYSTGLRTGM